jgi:hypothetical protein
LKKKLSLFALVFLFAFASFGTAASAATYTICDNDPSATNCYSYSNSNWVYKTGGYQGVDHRLTVTNPSSGGGYYVEFHRPTGNFIAGASSAYAYIDSDFTNRAADYAWYPDGSIQGYYLGTLDQYNAPNAAWSYVGGFTTSWNCSEIDITLDATGTSGTYTGADAMELVTP